MLQLRWLIGIMWQVPNARDDVLEAIVTLLAGDRVTFVFDAPPKSPSKRPPKKG